MSTSVVEQIVRPTGVVDPEAIVKPTKGQIDDLMRWSTTTSPVATASSSPPLTKKMAEDLTDYLLEQGLRVRYLHSNIDTIQRIEILRGLRLGDFDVLVGIKLLPEGSAFPRCRWCASSTRQGGVPAFGDVADPDHRSRCRNVDGQVVMYADTITRSMEAAIGETQRRRQVQLAYTGKWINPQTIRKAVGDILSLLDRTHGALPWQGQASPA